MSTQTNRPINRKVVLASHPDGMVEPTDFRIEEEEGRAPGDGEVLVKTEAISIDAFIRTSLNEDEGFHMAVPLGGVVTALAVGYVVESNTDALQAGDAVFGPLGAQTYGTFPGGMLQKVDDKEVPITAHLGALGLTTGLTAYTGMVGVGEVKEGDVVLVSGAAGAVGTMASQIAKLKGAKVIGVAGGPEKMKFLTETLGLDGGIDYKNDDLDARLKELAPDGIDVFFDNVGGEILEVAIANIRERGRVVICGAISQYNDHQNVHGPSTYLKLAERYAKMEGFTVMHLMHMFPQATEELTAWLKSGELKTPEYIEEGIDSFPTALKTMFSGGNMGKFLIKP